MDDMSMARSGRPTVYLHIGAPKTGTTYLQKVLWRNREALRNDGFLYPGDTFADHVHAAFDLRRAGFHGYRDPTVPGAWDRIVAEARAWDGTVIISQELFSPATSRQIDRAMEALNFAEVHIVYTARDLVRQIPAAWQEDIKNRFTIEFADFVESLRAAEGERHHLGTMFWRMQDGVEVLDRWSRGLPHGRVHVVTVPRPASPPGVLWERFAGLIGLDPGRYDAAGVGANLSLGAAEAGLLRRLNLALDDRVPWPVYSRYVKHLLGQEVLAGRRDPIKITLPAEAHEWATARSKDLVDGLRQAGYHVVGDLTELIPDPPDAPSGGPAVDEAPADLQLSAAVDAMAGLLQRLARMPGNDGPVRRRMLQLEGELAARRHHPIKHLVRDLSDRHRTVMRARVAWWHGVELAQRLRGRLIGG